MDASEAKALSDIEQYGCHILHVLEDGDNPPFSYSIGIERTANAPEAVIVGLKQPISQSIINEYYARVKRNGPLAPESLQEGMIEGHKMLAVPVDPIHYKEYFGWNLWLYKGASFRVVQLVYPTVDGVWPWSSQADDWFKKRQPLLSHHEKQTFAV